MYQLLKDFPGISTGRDVLEGFRCKLRDNLRYSICPTPFSHCDNLDQNAALLDARERDLQLQHKQIKIRSRL